MTGKTLIYAAVTGIYFLFMSIAAIFGPAIAESTAPKVQVRPITGGRMGDALQVYKYLVPSEAIREEGDQNCIYVMRKRKDFWVQGNIAVRVEVGIESSDGRQTAIVPPDGFGAAESVIVKADRRIRDGGWVYSK